MVNNARESDFMQAAELIRASKFRVALTGAGSSTPSGIPDFRSTGSGLWNRFSPAEVATLFAFRKNPERFFEWLRPFVQQMFSATPNQAHRALAVLENKGYLQTVITQNIDNLHQKAGATRVLEVHGSLQTLSCIKCYHQVETEQYSQPYLNQGVIPQCSKCAGFLKPDIVLFGEQLPAKTWLKARRAAEACDLMIIAGTSLIVSPVSELPLYAKENGARVLIINKSPTYMDPAADLVLRGDVAEIIPSIVEEVLNA